MVRSQLRPRMSWSSLILNHRAGVHSLIATLIWLHGIGFSLVSASSSLECDHFCQQQEAIHRNGTSYADRTR